MISRNWPCYILFAGVTTILLAGFIASLLSYEHGCPHFIDISCNLTQCYPEYCQYDIFSNYSEYSHLCAINISCYLIPYYNNITTDCHLVNDTTGDICYGNFSSNIKDQCQPHCFKSLSLVLLIIICVIGLLWISAFIIAVIFNINHLVEYDIL